MSGAKRQLHDMDALAIYNIADLLGIKHETQFDDAGNWIYTRFESDDDMSRAYILQDKLLDILNSEQ